MESLNVYMTKPTISSVAISHRGNIRSLNEDNFLQDETNHIWLVADGVGGKCSGEVASKLACDSISKFVAEGNDFESAIKLAHREICTSPQKSIGCAGMGTTIVGAHFTKNRFKLCWVGDSRAYLYSENTLRQISKDHSLVQLFIDDGVITKNEAKDFPAKNVITRCLGGDTKKEVEVDSVSGTLAPNEKLLLCSDGLTNELDDDEIYQQIRNAECSQDAINNLLSEALNHQGRDNITIMIIEPKLPNRVN